MWTVFPSEGASRCATFGSGLLVRSRCQRALPWRAAAGAAPTAGRAPRSWATSFVGGRGIDGDGNQDPNVVEKSAKPRKDDSPPVFSGAKSASPAAGGKVHVDWNAAKDDLTATRGISYVVWASDASPVDTSG